MRFCLDSWKLGLAWFGLFLCGIVADSENLSDKQDSHYNFFISEIFEKYGNNNVITYEGFEHLLENLGLGKLHFDTKHDVSIHKINGTFLEFHDELSLHKHNHSAFEKDKSDVSGSRRKKRWDIKEKERELNGDVKTALRRKCLTAQDILSTYGLQPYHAVAISPSNYLRICPAIVYELDQKLCQAEVVVKVNNKEEEYYLVWIYATTSIFVMGASGMLCVLLVPIVRSAYYTSVLDFLVALAVGTLSGDALIHLIPQVFSSNVQSGSNLTSTLRGTVALAAIFIFFTIENILKEIQNRKKKNIEPNKELGKMLPGNDCEQPHGHSHGLSGVKPLAWMVIMGDILHNVTDGLSVGAAFASSLSSGFASSIAIFCHELPHELGDYAILLASGMSIKKSLFYNFLSSIFSFLGMVAGVLLGEIKDASFWINSFTAGSFLYIALSDLIPEMKITESKSNSHFFVQIVGLCCGVTLMFSIALYEDEIENLLS